MKIRHVTTLSQGISRLGAARSLQPCHTNRKAPRRRIFQTHWIHRASAQIADFEEPYPGHALRALWLNSPAFPHVKNGVRP